MTLLWRALTAADCDAWAGLVAAAVAVDGGELYSAEDLAEELGSTRTVAAFDADTLLAVGQLMPPVERVDGGVRAGFSGVVRPASRGRGIGRELVTRTEAATLAWAAEEFPGVDVAPSTEVWTQAGRALLERFGYEAVRWYHVMAAHPEPAFRNPRVQRYRPALDAGVRNAHIEAFDDHFGFAPPDAERWATFFTGSRTFRPEFSSLAATIDGRVDGYLLAYQYGGDEIWIGQLGVRPEVRGRGIAKNLLRASMAEIAHAGISTVKLDVDSENATGAGRLYESVGFVQERSIAIYQKSRA